MLFRRRSISVDHGRARKFTETNTFITLYDVPFVNWLRNGRLSDPKPEDRITQQCPTAYNSDATCPRWRQFLEEVFECFPSEWVAAIVGIRRQPPRVSVQRIFPKISVCIRAIRGKKHIVDHGLHGYSRMGRHSQRCLFSPSHSLLQSHIDLYGFGVRIRHGVGVKMDRTRRDFNRHQALGRIAQGVADIGIALDVFVSED